jgi:hypothetical protein
MKTTEAGSEVLVYCSSCKMDLMATIVAKVGSKIVRIQCRTCRKELAYKAAKGVNDPAQAPAPKAKRASSGASAASAKSVSVNEEWKKLMSENAGKVEKVVYSAKKALVQGNMVVHPTFGEGIVMRVIYPDKAEILFEYDMKTLIHSKG